jgi:hypothetical protein
MMHGPSFVFLSNLRYHRYGLHRNSNSFRSVDSGARIWVALWASLSAWGQSTPENAITPRLAIPEWLAPFPQARPVGKGRTEGASSYTALTHSAAVVSHYQQQLRGRRTRRRWVTASLRAAGANGESAHIAAPHSAMLW